MRWWACCQDTGLHSQHPQNAGSLCQKARQHPSLHSCLRFGVERRRPAFAALANVEDIVGVNYQDFLYGLHSFHQYERRDLRHRTRIHMGFPGSGIPTWYFREERPLCCRSIICGRAWIILASPKKPWARPAAFLDNCLFRKVMVLLSAKPVERYAHGPYHQSANWHWTWTRPCPSWPRIGTDHRNR